VIREVCDTVAVIERGQVVETGPVWQVFGAPQHDATRALLRTLVHDLPADLAARVKPLHEVTSGDAQVLLDVRFTGADEREPDLGALAHALSVEGGRVSFVHGGIDRIQGHAQGRLVVTAQIPTAAGLDLADGARGADTPAVRAQIAALVERARQHANHVEVLGYV